MENTGHLFTYLLSKLALKKDTAELHVILSVLVTEEGVLHFSFLSRDLCMARDVHTHTDLYR